MARALRRMPEFDRRDTKMYQHHFLMHLDFANAEYERQLKE